MDSGRNWTPVQYDELTGRYQKKWESNGKDYILISTDGLAVCCGTKAYCNAQAQWKRLQPGWTVV